MSTSAHSAVSLTQSDIDGFFSEGYIRRVRVMSAQAMAVVRDRIDREVLTSIGPSGKRELCRHLDHPFLRDVIRSPALVDAFSRLIGPDLQCWSSNFWIKPPGGAMTCWHQDIGYWPINPPITFTAWVAIEPTTISNSCLQIIPRSHLQAYPVRKAAGSALDLEAVFDPCTLPPPVAIELDAGEAVLFNERILHHAAANGPDRRRIAMAVRVIPPFVKLDPMQAPLWPQHQCLRMSGQDRFGRNACLVE